ncbi:MAG: hypothetical protein H0U22_15975 [Geodermatophilaceae bacterium]|jgi:hypothetical protein|nr:hypothetical protein [Geodermatophilaceae bacterium]
MRRLFWLALGGTMGALVVRRLSAAAHKLTPGGIAESLSAGLSQLAEAIGDFAGDVRTAMGERERELRAGVGLDGQLGAKPEDFTA